MKNFKTASIVLALSLLTLAPATMAHSHYLTGDINKDGAVNMLDLSLLLSSYGKDTKKCITNSNYICDLNGDSHINLFDLSMLLVNYGKTS